MAKHARWWFGGRWLHPRWPRLMQEQYDRKSIAGDWQNNDGRRPRKMNRHHRKWWIDSLHYIMRGVASDAVESSRMDVALVIMIAMIPLDEALRACGIRVSSWALVHDIRANADDPASVCGPFRRSRKRDGTFALFYGDIHPTNTHNVPQPPEVEPYVKMPADATYVGEFDWWLSRVPTRRDVPVVQRGTIRIRVGPNERLDPDQPVSVNERGELVAMDAPDGRPQVQVGHVVAVMDDGTATVRIDRTYAAQTTSRPVPRAPGYPHQRQLDRAERAFAERNGLTNRSPQEIRHRMMMAIESVPDHGDPHGFAQVIADGLVRIGWATSPWSLTSALEQREMVDLLVRAYTPMIEQALRGDRSIGALAADLMSASRYLDGGLQDRQRVIDRIEADLLGLVLRTPITDVRAQERDRDARFMHAQMMRLATAMEIPVGVLFADAPPAPTPAGSVVGVSVGRRINVTPESGVDPVHGEYTGLYDATQQQISINHVALVDPSTVPPEQRWQTVPDERVRDGHLAVDGGRSIDIPADAECAEIVEEVDGVVRRTWSWSIP